LGPLRVDIAYGGDSFVIVDSAALGFAVQPDEARDLAEAGIRVIAAANEQLGLSHPEGGGWDHISFCQFAGPLTREGNELQGSNACVIRPGKIDRSPTGTGGSARMAVLSAHGQMAEGDVYRARSIIGPEFVCQIARRATIRDRPAIVPIISGRPGLPASVSICWTRPIRGRRATGSRIHGRALGRQFERLARFARLS
jgi:trans-L-3-hydroxyproline dehydratase